MNLNEYQCKSRETALYPNVGDNVVYPTLGLAGEVRVVRDIETGSVLTWDDVTLDENDAAVQARRQMEHAFAMPTH